MKIGEKNITIGTIVGAVLVIIGLPGATLSAWLYMDNHFEKKENHEADMIAMSEASQRRSLENEQSLIQLRMDTLEDRRDRAEEKGDAGTVRKIDKQLKQLDNRYDKVDDQLRELK